MLLMYFPIAILTMLLLDYTRGAGGPQGLVSNHLKSGGHEEDGGNLLKRMSDVRFSLPDKIMKSSHQKL